MTATDAPLPTRPATPDDVLAVLRDMTLQEGGTPAEVARITPELPLGKLLEIVAPDPLCGGVDVFDWTCRLGS